MDIEDELKFDCYPGSNVNKDLCLQRGCCWTPTYKQSVPFCYYPSYYALYSFVNVTRIKNEQFNGLVC